MFPFSWNIELEDIEKAGWKYQKFDIENCYEAYNEFYYFHEFVQRTLYNDNDKTNNEKSSFYYEKKEFDAQSFIFKVKGKEQPFNLVIDGVSLRTFETGVGILSINLKNIDHRSFEDVLMINDFGRRLYPQFLDASSTNIQYEINYADEVQNAFYPTHIKFGSMEEENLSMSRIAKYKLPQYITRLIGSFELKPLLDDRMYVISHIMDSQLSAEFKDDYLQNEKWYKYVYMDSKFLSCQNAIMRENSLRAATYDRWSDFGTLYGITRYSFVCISDSDDFSRKVINQHIRRHYFQMLNLTLAVRASIIRFSDEVATLSSALDSDMISMKVTDFYKRYIKFVNRLYFREISPHEQGIEIYAKLIDIMQIEKNIKDLDEEIAELFQYVEMKKQSELNVYMANISEKGIPLMVAGLITGFFGMNTIKFSDIDWDPFNIVTALATCIILYFGFTKYKSIDKFISKKGI